VDAVYENKQRQIVFFIGELQNVLVNPENFVVSMFQTLLMKNKVFYC